jgi:hypothetical protein
MECNVGMGMDEWAGMMGKVDLWTEGRKEDGVCAFVHTHCIIPAGNERGGSEQQQQQKKTTAQAEGKWMRQKCAVHFGLK